jgi:hypothetical protein
MNSHQTMKKNSKKTRATSKTNGNPTLLTMLKRGCSITFPSGYNISSHRHKQDGGEEYMMLTGKTPLGFEDGNLVLSRDSINWFLKMKSVHEKQTSKTANSIDI